MHWAVPGRRTSRCAWIQNQSLRSQTKRAMCTKPAFLHQRGISLIELIMFIVIVSAALAGILLVMNQVIGRSADPLLRKQALAVGESLLEEIRLQDLSGTACAGTLGADAPRSGVSAVCDYNGYTTTNG